MKNKAQEEFVILGNQLKILTKIDNNKWHPIPKTELKEIQF